MIAHILKSCYSKTVSIFCGIAFLFNFFVSAFNQRPMVVVVPSYNNQQWTAKNLSTILTQQYDNFQVIFIDDCSSDQNDAIAKQTIDANNGWGRTTFIRNPTRQGAMANLYNAIHSCPDDAIIATVDGDDWLPHAHVLSYLNNEYSTGDIWLTFGQFVSYPRNQKGFNAPFEPHIIRNNQFRQSRGHLPMSHLRTFEAWLFKRVKLQDFLYDGTFLTMTWDKAMMAPMVEMACERHKCIANEILYVYNEANPINDHKVDMGLQHRLCDIILSKPPYKRMPDRSTITALCHGKRAELILFCDDYDGAVASVAKASQALHEIYCINVVCKAESPETLTNFQRLKAEYPLVKLFSYQNNNFKQALVDCLNHISSDYIVIAQSGLGFVECNMTKVIYDLERTGAFSYVLATESLRLQKYAQLADNVQACQYKYAPAGWNVPYQALANCYRTSSIRDAIYNHSYATWEECLLQANRMAYDNEDIFLIHQ